VATAGVANAETSVWYGPPVEAIVEAARYRKADLIVMSSHGRSGVGRLVLGSIAESVLRSTSVPILLIRPGDVPLESPFVGATRAKEVARV
jgi:nucleotide-binding universal stress UspA family protein